MTVELESQGNNAAPAYLTTPDFFARLQRDSATQLSLQNYKGTVVEVNAERVAIGSAGFTLLNTANLISATGTDSGGAPAVTTLYYCYVSNSLSSFAPLGIRLSATAPSLFNGVKYLAAAGNGANWRFVGWVRTISNGGTVNFADTAGGGAVVGQRLVVNYYNRIRKNIGFICPGYVDNNAYTAQTNVVAGAANWAPVNAGANEQSLLISNGEDTVEILFQATTLETPGGTIAFIGVAIDGVNPAVAATFTGVVGVFGDLAGGTKILLAEGYHTLDMVFALAGAGTYEIYWDAIRLGAAADPMLSGYSVSVMV